MVAKNLAPVTSPKRKQNLIERDVSGHQYGNRVCDGDHICVGQGTESDLDSLPGMNTGCQNIDDILSIEKRDERSLFKNGVK